MIQRRGETDMRLFGSNTLRQRLVVITLFTTGLSLMLAGGALFVSQYLSLRDSMIRDITIKADIAGNQCSAALVFKVRKEAEEILGAMRADRHIEYAAVFTADEFLFAEYRRDGKVGHVVEPIIGEAYRFGMEHLDVVHPIVLQGEQIGSLFIRSDLKHLHALQFRFITAAAVVLVISLLAAYLLIARLQNWVTKPVTSLVALTGRIAGDRDFSRKAELSGPEELSSLARGFNDMLQTIQDRDQELGRQRQDLEITVARLRQSSEELREANRKLQALDKLKSDFISIVSHELRTPLTAIKAFVELLIVKQDMPAERKMKLLRTVNDESDRLGRLISDLLDLTKIEAGTINWRMSELSMHDIIQLSVDMLLPSSRNKGLRVSVNVDPSLPRFKGDRDRLVQVVTNILSNAIKFTAEGGDVSVSAQEENKGVRQLVVAISDTGIGIPEEELDQIFDKFHRAGDLLTNKVEGTGLGLSIARQIVEHHGGRIWATSTYGTGSTILFTLPLHEKA